MNTSTPAQTSTSDRAALTDAAGDDSSAPRTLPIIEESLDVTRSSVDLGGYRITKRVGARFEQLDELLNDSKVEIERRPLGREVDAANLPQPRYEGATFVIPVLAEVLVKRVMLVEEVRVTRVDSTRHESQSVELRTEEVSIERLGAAISSPSTPKAAD